MPFRIVLAETDRIEWFDADADHPGPYATVKMTEKHNGWLAALTRDIYEPETRYRRVHSEPDHYRIDDEGQTWKHWFLFPGIFEAMSCGESGRGFRIVFVVHETHDELLIETIASRRAMAPLDGSDLARLLGHAPLESLPEADINIGRLADESQTLATRADRSLGLQPMSGPLAEMGSIAREQVIATIDLAIQRIEALMLDARRPMGRVPMGGEIRATFSVGQRDTFILSRERLLTIRRNALAVRDPAWWLDMLDVPPHLITFK
jgi:hypothetical protein